MVACTRSCSDFASHSRWVHRALTHVRREYRGLLGPPVFGLRITGCLEPLLDRVSGQPRAPGYLAVCQSVAQLHAPDLTYHVHGDHLALLLLKNSAEE